MLRAPTVLATTLLFAIILPATPAANDAHAGAAFIQPGDLVSTSTGQCTLNFVFDGVGVNAGKVYMGTAAHCTSSIGQSASTNGVGNFGTVAFRGNPDSTPRDYAFIEVAAAHVGKVRAEVRGHAGQPTGSTVFSETLVGDVLRFSGYGLGFSTTAPTREERVGVLWGDSTATYTLEGPIIFGDSGGPILHDSGKAFGIVSAIAVTLIPPVADVGPTVQGILVDAAANGFPVALRTV